MKFCGNCWSPNNFREFAGILRREAPRFFSGVKGKSPTIFYENVKIFRKSRLKFLKAKSWNFPSPDCEPRLGILSDLILSQYKMRVRSQNRDLDIDNIRGTGLPHVLGVYILGAHAGVVYQPVGPGLRGQKERCGAGTKRP